MKENGYFYIMKGSAHKWINWFVGVDSTTGSLTRVEGEISNTFAGETLWHHVNYFGG
jgi:hypothetical protein